jgi:streptogramin lyase
MRKFRLIVIILLSLVAGLGLTVGALAALSSQETPLNPTSVAFEINPDSQGLLWITEYQAGEVRRVNPSNGNFTVYPVGGHPSDARSDGTGMLWWGDTDTPLVGRLNTTNGQVSEWTIPGGGGTYGTALDGSGGIWVADYIFSFLYHLRPSASEVCTYTLPADAASAYLLVNGSQVWLGDTNNGRIGRLETNTNTFTWWALPSSSSPLGLAMDGAGVLWWADKVQGGLGRLTPGSGQVITYTQSTLQTPTMIALSAGKVWYTDQSRIGVLDPAHATGHAFTVTPSSQVSPPLCKALAAPSTRTIVSTSGQAAWSNASYPLLSSQPGWQVFQLPQQGYGWGIAALEDNIWLVDQGRQVLAKVSTQIESLLYLPLVIR